MSHTFTTASAFMTEEAEVGTVGVVVTMGGVISLELARQLRAAGVRWDLAPGDKFVLPDRGMDDDVFVISRPGNSCATLLGLSEDWHVYRAR